MKKSPEIRIENLNKSFGKNNSVLKDINLQIKPGLINFIIGQSGVGKSVLLKHLIGLMSPDSGLIYFNEQIINYNDQKIWKLWRKRMGILFQDGALFDFLTVGQNICFPLTIHQKISYKKSKTLALEQMKKLDIESTFNFPVSSLSIGEKKRVALARALILSPDILFFDEPTTGLDPFLSDQVDELILNTKKETQATLVVISHDIPATLNIADQISLIYDGKIRITGSANELKNSSDPVVKQFLTAAEDGPIAKLSEV